MNRLLKENGRVLAFGAHPDDLVAAVERAARDSANDRVQPGTVASAGQNADSLSHHRSLSRSWPPAFPHFVRAQRRTTDPAKSAQHFSRLKCRRWDLNPHGA